MLEVIAVVAAVAFIKAVAAMVPYMRWRRRRHGELTFDHEPNAWTIDMLKEFKRDEAQAAAYAARTALPQVVMPTPEVQMHNAFGLVGFIDSQGTLRLEHGRYDPLAGRVVTEPNDSVGPTGTVRDGLIDGLADVIDLRKRRGGEL